MRSRILIAALAAIALLSSCKTQYDAILYGSDTAAKYKMAFELFEAKKYAKAAETFENLSTYTRGTAQDDTVQFYWGLSNYRYGDYVTAESNLNQFITTFPMSVFTEEAKFLRLDCLYHGTYRYELDPMPTYKALSEMNVFQIENPNSQYHERVDKMIDNLKDRQRERYLVFVDDYFNLISEYPESKYAKELESLYTKVQKYLKKDNQDG